MRTDADDPARRMDAMYRWQRHFYDLTRKYYLIGRDRMLRSLPVQPGACVLEMGCGTGRNLVALAKLRPAIRLYGVDASLEMLRTAEASIRRAGLAERVALAPPGAADAFDPVTAFGVAHFDVIYFSYVLSMIPDWRAAVEHALALLKPGGVLAIVDFADQSLSPAWRRRLLLGWLRLFDVDPRPEIEAGLRSIPKSSGCIVVADRSFAGYAYFLMLQKSGGGDGFCASSRRGDVVKGLPLPG